MNNFTKSLMEKKKVGPGLPMEASKMELSKSKEVLKDVKEKFGQSLLIFSPNNELVIEQLGHLDVIPNGFAETMRHKGLKIAISSGNMYDLLGYMSGAKYRILEGLSKLLVADKLKEAAGGYNSLTKTLFVLPDKGKQLGDLSIILHEYGHGVGDLLNLNQSDFFRKFHQEYFEKLDEYVQQGKPGSSQGIRELVADTFSDYLKLEKADFVDIYSLDMYTFWKDFILENYKAPY